VALKPSERATLLEEIAKRMSAKDWAVIDSTLQSFSLPAHGNWPDWDGNTISYVLYRLREAPAEALVELADHVGFSLNVKPATPIPTFWAEGMFRLFITHLAAHRETASNLKEKLLECGVSSFVAHNDIEPTKEWLIEIEKALSTCEALVALLHPKFHASDWTDQEIGYAIGRGVPVYSIRFGVVPYGFIGRYQAFNGNDKTSTIIAAELFNALRRDKQTQRRMSEVLVDLFVSSRSYKDAKTYVGYLEDLTFWKSDYSKRIRGAVKHNTQISDSYGVPGRVATLVKRWAKDSS
jgi:nucleoside 2-deoxyribosyltransferase